METNNSSEIYIFLGLQQSTYFFSHFIANDNFKNEISSQIYNVLINDNQIISPDENVIIYDFNPKNNTCDIVCLTHMLNSNPNVKFYKDNLEDFYSNLISAQRTDLYVVEYDYEKKAYLNYMIDEPLQLDAFNNIKKNMPDSKLSINNVFQWKTTKPIVSK